MRVVQSCAVVACYALASEACAQLYTSGSSKLFQLGGAKLGQVVPLVTSYQAEEHVYNYSTMYFHFHFICIK